MKLKKDQNQNWKIWSNYQSCICLKFIPQNESEKAPSLRNLNPSLKSMNKKFTESKGIHHNLNKSTEKLEREKKLDKNFSKKVKGQNFVNFWLITNNLLTSCQLRRKIVKILHLTNCNLKLLEIEEENWGKIIMKSSSKQRNAYNLTHKLISKVNWEQMRNKLSCKNFQNSKKSKSWTKKSFIRILRSPKRWNKWLEKTGLKFGKGIRQMRRQAAQQREKSKERKTKKGAYYSDQIVALITTSEWSNYNLR